MLPEYINKYSILFLLGTAANGMIAILCMVTFAFYRHYRPLKFLFLFYITLTFCLLGFVIFGSQRSEESILWGFRIAEALMALLSVCGVWFIYSLLDERKYRIPWMITGIGFLLFAMALIGRGTYFFDLPLEPNPLVLDILRPQSKLLRLTIESFSLATCLFYFILIAKRLWHVNGQQKTYLFFLAIGILFLFMGGVIESFRAAGTVLFTRGRVLWFPSFVPSVFFATGVIMHFRSVEQAARKELERLGKVQSKALDHLSHELRTPLSVMKGSLIHLKRTLHPLSNTPEGRKIFEDIEKELWRLANVQVETGKLICDSQEFPQKTLS